MFTTLYTNPFTIVPLYVAAYAIGKFVTGGGNGGLPFDFDWRNGNWLAAVPAFLQWVAALGAPLFVGLFLLAGLLAAVSYFTVQGLWRLHVIRAWRKRQRRRGG